MGKKRFLWLTAAVLAACSEHQPHPPGPDKIPFDTSVDGLPEALETRVETYADGDTIAMDVEYVRKDIAGHPVRMMAYNRRIPGPTFKVPEGATVTLKLTNRVGLPTTLHSHGLRQDAQYDGMPGMSQDPIDSGETFVYKLRFPDPGIYWYHPHIRESYGLELGLYGNYLVVPKDSAYWSPVHREELLVLDDLLTDGQGKIRVFYKNLVDFTMMGRFGNVFLVNGRENHELRVKRGEVIRFFATNVSGSRTYNLRFPQASLRLLLVGADNGKSLNSELRREAIIAPSERLVFHTQFHHDGKDTLVLQSFPRGRNLEPPRDLMRVVFDPDSASPDLSASMVPATDSAVQADIDLFRLPDGSFPKDPDEELFITGYMDHGHETIAARTQGPEQPILTSFHDSSFTDRMGIEWYDHMSGMNTLSDTSNMTWIVRDVKTGKENHAIHWTFRQNRPVLIRIKNDSTSTTTVPGRMMHPMPHPIHFHGQRFLVVREGPLGRAGNLRNLVWRDSYLVGTGFEVDLLLDVSNPGEWMFHCHIPEHFESDMLGHFTVTPALVKGAAAAP